MLDSFWWKRVRVLSRKDKQVARESLRELKRLVEKTCSLRLQIRNFVLLDHLKIDVRTQSGPMECVH